MNEVQQKEFQVLEEVQRILKRHNLKYYAIGGTCIGAVRHKGFIPWDDDIDIGMPRKDYELFCNIYHEELPKQYKLMDGNISQSNSFIFSKVHDSTTTLIINGSQHMYDRYVGAYVDIMPIDGLPPNMVEIKKLDKKMTKYAQYNNWSRPIPQEDRKKNIRGIMGTYINKWFRRKYEYNHFLKKISHDMSSYDYETSKYIYFTWRVESKELSIRRKVFLKDIFEELIEVPFESGKIMIPKRYDEYLKQDFGDYMTIPPESDRESHNNYIVDMKKPYTYYLEQEKQNKK